MISCKARPTTCNSLSSSWYLQINYSAWPNVNGWVSKQMLWQWLSSGRPFVSLCLYVMEWRHLRLLLFQTWLYRTYPTISQGSRLDSPPYRSTRYTNQLIPPFSLPSKSTTPSLESNQHRKEKKNRTWLQIPTPPIPHTNGHPIANIVQATRKRRRTYLISRQGEADSHSCVGVHGNATVGPKKCRLIDYMKHWVGSPRMQAMHEGGSCSGRFVGGGQNISTSHHLLLFLFILHAWRDCSRSSAHTNSNNHKARADGEDEYGKVSRGCW